MFLIDSAGSQSGSFVDRNPVSATPGTVVSAEWLNAVQYEVVNAITAFNVSLEKADNFQLSKILDKSIKLANFGAKLDGVNDDWDALVLAIMYAISTGENLIAERGICLIRPTQALDISADGIKLDLTRLSIVVHTDDHDGVNSRVFICSGDNQDIRVGNMTLNYDDSTSTKNPAVDNTFELSGDGSTFSCLKVEGALRHLRVSGNDNTVIVGNSIVNNAAVGHCVINGNYNKLRIKSCSGSANDGIVANGGDYNTIHHCRVTGVDETCYDDIGGVGNKWLYNVGHDNVSSNPLMRIGQNGFEAKNFEVIGNILYNAAGLALYIEGDNGNAASLSEQSFSGTVCRNIIFDNSGNGMDLVRAGLNVYGNILSNNSNGIRVRDGASYSNVRDNVIISHSGDGISIDTTSAGVIERGVKIESNKILDCLRGMFVENCRNYRIRDNWILASAASICDDGIEFNANAQLGIVDGNVIHSNVTNPITNPPSNVQFGDNYDENGINKTGAKGEAIITNTNASLSVGLSLWFTPKFIQLTAADPAQPVGWDNATLSEANIDILRVGSSGDLRVQYRLST